MLVLTKSSPWPYVPEILQHIAIATAGMLRIDGIMTGRNRMFDTPGVPHDHQLSARLTADEVTPNSLLLSVH